MFLVRSHESAREARLAKVIGFVQFQIVEAQIGQLSGDYAQKYWEAGNLVVTLTFGATFAIYYVLLKSPVYRAFLTAYWKPLVGLSAVGNLALAFLLWRFSVNEQYLAALVSADEALLEPIRSGFELRLGLLIFNFAMYLFVIAFVVQHPDPKSAGDAGVRATEVET